MEGKGEAPLAEDDDYLSDDWPYAEAAYFADPLPDAFEALPEEESDEVEIKLPKVELAQEELAKVELPEVEELPAVKSVGLEPAAQEPILQESIPNPDPIVEAELVDSEMLLAEQQLFQQSEFEIEAAVTVDTKAVVDEPSFPVPVTKKKAVKRKKHRGIRRHFTLPFLTGERNYSPLVIIALCALMFTIGLHTTNTAPPEQVLTNEEIGIDPILIERFLAIDRLFAQVQRNNRNEVAEFTGSELIVLLTAENLKSKKADLALVEASQRKDERITEVLSTLATNKDPAVRAKAIKALGSPFHLEQKIGYDSVSTRMEKDKDNLVRAYAAKTLSNSNRQEALALLQTQLLKEDNSFVNAVLIRSIEKAMKKK